MRFLKFCCVGFVGVVVNLLTFTFCEYLSFHYLVAAIVAFFVAVTNNFVLNSFWTFKDRIKKHEFINYKRYAKFVSFSVVCLVGNLWLLVIFVEKLNLVHWQAQVLAVGFMSAVNFLMQNMVTFVSKKDPKAVSSL